MIMKTIKKHFIYLITSFILIRYSRLINFNNALKTMFAFFDLKRTFKRKRYKYFEI